MSDKLYQDYKKQVEDLNEKLNEYYDEYLEDMTIDNVRLKDALKSQVTLQLVFESFYAKTKRLQGLIEEEMENAYSVAITEQTSNNYRDVSISEAKEAAKGNRMYRLYRRLNIEAKALVSDANATLETVTTRRYVMNNMSNAIIASVENTIL